MNMLELDQIRIDGGTQSRVELNQETVADYAQAFTAGASFPPVVAFFDGANYWLADGFHRYFGAKDAGESAIDAEIINGTQRDAVLYSLKANATHGLRRTNADKRKAVETLLKDAEWATWSDRKIAEVCGVGAPLVGDVRRSICNPITDAPATRTVTRNGTTYTQNTANVGKKKGKKKGAPASTQEKPPFETEPSGDQQAAHQEVEPEIEAPPEYTELDAAHDQISELQAELVVARMGDIPEEEKQQAAGLIAELHAEIKTLNATLAAVTLSRDTLMEERAQMLRQMKAQRAEIDRLKSTK